MNKKTQDKKGHSSYGGRNLNELVKKIEKLGVMKEYSRNEFLFQAEDEATGFFYVLSGAVRIFKMDENGKEVEVARLEPGDFFGEAIIFVSNKFPSFAQAVRESRIIFFEKRKILEEIERKPDVAKLFLNLLARKCVILNQRIEFLGLRTVRQRLISYLLSRCSGGMNCQIKLEITKGDLARLLGTVNETLSRILKQMQEEGLIEVKHHLISIINCPELRQEITC